MALTGSTNEKKIWNYLIGKGLNAYGAAGLMGNLYAESGLIPTNLQNSYERSLGFTDAEYTDAVDNGRYTNFVKDSAGYGLCQWTFWSRKQNLLAFAKAAGKSIGDLEMQLDFLMKELTGGYIAVLNVLKSAKTVKEASDCVLVSFERPADQSDAAKVRRAGFGEKYFNNNAGSAVPSAPTVTTGGTSMTEQQLRKKIVDTAVGFLGYKESDGSHRKIIDLYNSHKPLAVGYKVQYDDAWCSTFASAVAIKADMTDIIPTECGCQRHIELFKKLGAWQENDAYIPKMGDYVFYDWQDGENFATTDNTGSADHIGIVVSATAKTIKVIEGNISNAVGYRNLAVNGRYIRGFGVPKYASKAGSQSTEEVQTPTVYTPVSQTPTTNTTDGYSVGDKVNFTGTKHYSSAASTSPKSCTPGQAKVTAISKGARHPYHLVHTDSGNVYGWVDADDINGEVKATSSTYTVVPGDTLYGIAEKRLGAGSRWKEIYTLNGLKTTTIRAGQKLKIPS